MKVQAILERLNELGVSIRVDGDNLRLNPGDKVPAEMVSELKAHKQAIISVLRGRTLKYAGPASRAEAEEIEAIVAEQGVCLVWSSALNDSIAFIATEQDAARVPAGFTIYTSDDLAELFARDISVEHLKRIHAIKKIGANLVKSKESQGNGPSHKEDDK